METAERKEIIETIERGLRELIKVNVADLVGEKVLGEQLSFKRGEEAMMEIIEITKRVNGVDLRKIPKGLLVGLEAQLRRTFHVFNEIHSFQPAVENPIKKRDELVNAVIQQYESYYSNCVPILIHDLLNSDQFSEKKANLNNALYEIDKEKERIIAEGNKYVSEVMSVLDNAKQAAAKVGINQYAMVFQQEATDNKRLANKWMIWTVGILICIVGVAVLFLAVSLNKEVPESTNEFIQLTVTKIIILAALFYGLSICSKNYKAHKHNYILNKHRQNALSTFETFSKAAGTDIQTKNAVLLEATHSIFSNQQTGYLTRESDNDSPNKIIEIIKNATNGQ